MPHVSKSSVLADIDAIVDSAPAILQPKVEEVRRWVKQTAAILGNVAPLETEAVRLYASFLIHDDHDLRRYCLTEILDTVYRVRWKVASSMTHGERNRMHSRSCWQLTLRGAKGRL